MDLLNKLVEAGRQIPPTSLPSANDLLGAFGALVLHVQHGPEFLNAAAKGTEALDELLAKAADDVNRQTDAEQQTGTVAQQQPSSTVAGGAVSTAPAATPPSTPPSAPTDPLAATPADERIATPHPSEPGTSQPAQLTDAEIVAQIESLQAQLGSRQRTTIETV